MADDRRDEIAALLQRRLEELRRRDEAAGTPFGARRPAPAAVRAAERRPPQAPSSAAPALDVVRLRNALVARHRGQGVVEALGGTLLGGRPDLVEVVAHVDVPLRLPEPAAVRDALASSLWLLPGVRDAVAARLRETGFPDLVAAVAHPRLGVHARRVLRSLERGDVAALLEHVALRAGRGHPLALAVAGLLDAGDLTFLDIETMGLFGGSPIILVGLAHRVAGDTVRIRQVVAATPAAEAALLREVAAEAGARPALVTFNGRTFDWPYIGQRAAFYGVTLSDDPVHFDLLWPSRRAFAGRTTDCRLDTLAREVLGMDRGEDVPGSLVPAFYQDYLEDPAGRAGLLAAIAAHNLADMEQMVRLFARLAGGA